MQSKFMDITTNGMCPMANGTAEHGGNLSKMEQNSRLLQKM